VYHHPVSSHHNSIGGADMADAYSRPKTESLDRLKLAYRALLKNPRTLEAEAAALHQSATEHAWKYPLGVSDVSDVLKPVSDLRKALGWLPGIGGV